MNISIQGNLFDCETYTTKNGVFGANIKLIDFKTKTIVDLNTSSRHQENKKKSLKNRLFCSLKPKVFFLS